MPTGNNGERNQKSNDSVRLKRRTMLASMGVASAGFLAGCTSGDGDDDGTGGGNMFRFADPERPPTLDPHAVDPTDTNASFAYPEQGYETLLAYSVDGGEGEEIELVPALATEVPSAQNGLISEDGTTVEFPLREGVMFHTGGEMTADDVVYSWERSMTMNLAPGAANLNGTVDSMEAVDDYTFRVQLAQETTPIFLNSVVTDTSAVIVSEEAVEENGGYTEGQQNEWMAQNSAGTGPFMLGQSDPDAWVWDAHEDYWGETGIGTIEHNFIGDTSSRVAQLGEGDLDYIYISVGEQTEVEGYDDVEILSGPQINPGGIKFNANIPYDEIEDLAGDDTIPSDFFADKAVRQAFAHAIPWSDHIDSILDGYGIRTNCVHVPSIFGYDGDAPQWEQDLDLVEERLQEAGFWEEGFRMTLYNEDISEFENLNLAIKDTLEGLNDRIEINSVTEPESQAVERDAADPPQWPASVHGLLPIGTDPTPYYEFFMHPDGDMGSRNGIPEVIDDRIIELIDMTRTETDQDARLEQFSELQELCYEEVPVAFGYAPEEVFPHRSCVETVNVAAWNRPHFKHWDNSNC